MSSGKLRRGFRAWRRLPAFGPKRRLAHALAKRADLARDQGQFEVAALLYEQMLLLAPGRVGIHVQCGHMFKEAGDLASAELHYGRAQALTPDDPDLALQLGHFYKVARRKNAAEEAYRRALALRPGWAEALKELEALNYTPVEPSDAPIEGAGHLDLVPEIAPTRRSKRPIAPAESLAMRRLGTRRERSRWGVMTALRGIEAVRGVCLAKSPVNEVQILLDREVIHTARPVFCKAPEGQQGKYVFNEWVDFSLCAEGRREIEVRCVCADGSTLFHRQHVLIAAPLTPVEQQESDAAVALPAGGDGSTEERVNALPSTVRPARRQLFPNGLHRVLVMRTDQLGDMVSSIPALRRLRELLPHAHLTGLLTNANADLARTLGLFDEIIIVDFPEDWEERKRVMPFARQEALKQQLAQHHFDLAIDLAESSVSRPLLLLSGAPFLYGFHDNDWPWLTAGFVGNAHDAKNYAEIAPPSAKVLALIERLGTLLDSGAEVIRRDDLDRGMLERFSIGADTRYAVLHDGARIAFSHWPHYLELAELLVRHTGLKVILLSESHVDVAELPPALQDANRFLAVEGRLPFDAFDALLSFADLFVGNDSGPKHLASLRGVPVVSLHSARVNWNEWGQELTGTIISRRVPCAGCAIFHDADECGKEFACVRLIKVSEVFEAATALLTDHG